MKFLTVTDEEREQTLADHVLMRERELLHYETAMAQYQAILETLPQDDWPEDIAQYRGHDVHKLAAVLPDETMERVALYARRDFFATLLRTEKIEHDKSLAYYNAVLNSIPQERRATVLEQAKVRHAGNNRG